MMQIDFLGMRSRQAMLALKLKAGGSEIEKQAIISIGHDVSLALYTEIFGQD